jgi:L-seryl-tRNA(Ser) seleniumtransferase
MNAGSTGPAPGAVVDETEQAELRSLPSVEQLLQTEPLRSAAGRRPRPLAVEAARREISRAREVILGGNGGPPDVSKLASSAAAALERATHSSLAAVINATGVVVHTNLGRAPLPFEALEAIDSVASGYSNLEYELQQGARGSRQAHVDALLCELTGAEAALVVNNNAAGVLLVVAALAQGREVVISRGQLIEIGESFRIPEILEASGARLVEVGTTNRTRLADYESAIGPETAALMRVHASNFRTVGFTEEVGIGDLCELGRVRELPVIDDLGSGVLSHRDDALGALLADEPAARDSVAAGAAVVCFSGDKLLGGPQAGLLVGRRDAIARLRRHPLARALRIDKLALAALEATLRLHREPEGAKRDIPVLQMLAAGEEELAARAEALHVAVAEQAGEAAELRIIRSAARAGGGSLPLLELDGPVLAVAPHEGGAEALHARLRLGDPPVVARVKEGVVLLDPRTISDVEVDFVVKALVAALRQG